MLGLSEEEASPMTAVTTDAVTEITALIRTRPQLIHAKDAEALVAQSARRGQL
jgi:hypothetical protein